MAATKRTKIKRPARLTIVQRVGHGSSNPHQKPAIKQFVESPNYSSRNYKIPHENVFGHDFTPGYKRPGGTSCPDKLFGSKHSQAAITAWVKANV